MSKILDNIIMLQDLHKLFASTAHFLVLRTLTRHVQPIHLRAIVHLTNLHVHSVENALKSLVQYRAVSKKRVGNRVTFELNNKSQYTAWLKTLFDALYVEALSRNARSLEKQAQERLRFIDSTLKTLKKAKKG